MEKFSATLRRNYLRSNPDPIADEKPNVAAADIGRVSIIRQSDES